MLTNLTNRLIQDDVNRFNEEVFVEAVVNPTKISKIERYSLINESVDCSDIEPILESVSFSDNDSPEDRLDKLYDACSVHAINETVEFNQKTKRLTMSQEDYETVKSAIVNYKKAKTDE